MHPPILGLPGFPLSLCRGFARDLPIDDHRLQCREFRKRGLSLPARIFREIVQSTSDVMELELQQVLSQNQVIRGVQLRLPANSELRQQGHNQLQLRARG